MKLNKAQKEKNHSNGVFSGSKEKRCLFEFGQTDLVLQKLSIYCQLCFSKSITVCTICFKYC